jgi:hypothetical protein
MSETPNGDLTLISKEMKIEKSVFQQDTANRDKTTIVTKQKPMWRK